MSIPIFLKNLFQFKYEEQMQYEFVLPKNSNNLPTEQEQDSQKIFEALPVNIEYLKTKYNLLINSDVKIRKFALPIYNKKIPAALLYIDGMVNETSITEAILQPLLLKNSITMQDKKTSGRISIKNNNPTKKLNLENFIYNGLIPHNSVSKENDFSLVIQKVNSGFCALFVDTIGTAFCIETKGFKGRSITKPISENIVRGAQEGFVENIRTNTSMLRKIINNENLVIEEVNVRKNKQNTSCNMLYAKYCE